MLVCNCGRWMHTEGVDERSGPGGEEHWLVRSECRGCGLRVGLEGPVELVGSLVDRLVWSDDARHALERMPPYVAWLVRPDIEDYARSKHQPVVTWNLFAEARQGGAMSWDPDAEERLQNIPAPIRAMAKVELERTASERGESRVTVSLMEEVKARYFGMAAGGRNG